jgi:hypothetical protein
MAVSCIGGENRSTRRKPITITSILKVALKHGNLNPLAFRNSIVNSFNYDGQKIMTIASIAYVPLT